LPSWWQFRQRFTSALPCRQPRPGIPGRAGDAYQWRRSLPSNRASSDGRDADGPYHHSADRFVPYRAAEAFILQGEKCRNPLGVSLERTGDGPVRVVLSNEEEQVPVLLELTVAEAGALARALGELTGMARP
jgi:hypothetical protein